MNIHIDTSQPPRLPRASRSVPRRLLVLISLSSAAGGALIASVFFALILAFNGAESVGSDGSWKRQESIAFKPSDEYEERMLKALGMLWPDGYKLVKVERIDHKSRPGFIVSAIANDEFGNKHEQRIRVMTFNSGSVTVTSPNRAVQIAVFNSDEFK